MANITPTPHPGSDMHRPPLTFNEISIHRAPGISPGFTLSDLSPDITIVFGPNASGKSTTARAIQMVLWPHTSALRGHHLAASFAIGDEHWSIDAHAGRVQRFRNDDPADAPMIAPLDDRARYSLGLPDLLASENQPLAQAILKESSSGFDLQLVADSLDFSESIPPRLESARKVQSASNALQAVIAAEERIREALAERSHLHARREESMQAERDITAIDLALEYRQHLSDEADLAATIEGFSHEVRSFTGDEPQEIAELTHAIQRQQQKLTDAHQQRGRWQHLVNITRLSEIPSPEDRLKSLQHIQGQQSQIETLISDVDRNLAAAISERQSHQQRLAHDLDDDQIAALDASGMREFAEIAAMYENIRARRTARDEVELWLGGVNAPENLPHLQRGVELLQSRLQHPNAAEHRELTSKARWIGIGGGVLLAGTGAVLATTVDPWWWLLLALSVVLMILAWRFTSSDSPLIAAKLEDSYTKLNLPQPEYWRASPVQELLGQLREDLKIALVEQEKADRWQDLEQERAELDVVYTQTESRRQQAIKKYGVAPDLKEESLRLLAENLGRWQAADATVRGFTARRNKLETDYATSQRSAESSLEEFGYDDGELSIILDDLQRRIESLQHATSERDAIQSEIDDVLQPKLKKLSGDRDGVYQRFQLEPGDRTGLQHLQNQRTQLLEAQHRLDHQRRTSRGAWEALSLTPHWREQDVDQLTSARNRAQAIADNRPQIEDHLRDLDQQERSAMRSRDHEVAAADLTSAKQQMAQDRDRVAASVVGDLLLTTVQQETRDAALPLVFHRARELFSIITRGKYELQFEAGPPPEFTTLDTATGLTLALDQLSSGTRVQLLMAVRLSFVENMEVGPKLPIILDETLGNSDEFRASAIIDAAIDICRHGRQVFYFTAQGEEVARWQHRIEAMPEDERPQIKVIDLAEVRRDAGFDSLPVSVPTIAKSVTVPSPADYDADTWAAALRVPTIDPWAPIGGVHLWHLVSDADVLHALLTEDVLTYGQLESMERTTPSRLALIHPQLPDDLRGIHSRRDLLLNAINMWRIGRAHPMHTGALAEADMIDADDLDELQALQTEADNDGEALLEMLQTTDDAPLAEKPREALELWMISEGYIAQGQQMGETDIRSRLIELVSPAIRAGSIEAHDIEHAMTQIGSW